MSRQNYRQVGLIAALVVASVSLPVGIIGLTREPEIVNNYYNTYNYYYNQTYYGENETGTEPEPYYPPETVTYLNMSGSTPLEYVWFHHRVYNLTGNYVINWYFNQTQINTSFLYIIQDYMFDLWLENLSYAYQGDGFSNAGIKTKEWAVPFIDTWHIYFGFQYVASNFSITIRTLISKI